MKRRLVLIGVVVAAVLLVWAGWRAMRHTPETAGAAPASPSSSSASVPSKNPAPGAPMPAPPTPTGQESAPAPSAPAGAVPPAPAPAPRVVSRQPPQMSSPAREEAEAIALNLRHFGQRFGGNPVGTNAEIVKVLNGGNPQGARYLPQEHLRLNEQGELLDAFGTPYFFHQLSAEEMEIRSAGPDKTLWTQDDIAVK